MRAPASRKYVAEQGIAMPNGSKTFQTFRSHSSVFLCAATKHLEVGVTVPLKPATTASFGGKSTLKI